MLKSFPLLLALIVSSVLAAGPAERWWAHVVHLSQDAFKGRAAGTPEYRKAAEYVAAEFERAGLRPGAAGSYFQAVPIREMHIDVGASRVSIKGTGAAHALAFGKDVIPWSGGKCDAVDLPLTFVGYGLSIPEAGHDDIAGVDLQGKVAVYLFGGPSSLKGTLASWRQSTAERWRAFHKRGAAGMIVLYNPAAPGGQTWDAITAQVPPMMPVLGSGGGLAESRVSFGIGTSGAEKVFEGASATLEQVLEAARKGAAVPRVPLETRVVSNLVCTERPNESDNVVAIREGEELQNEYVVLTAHLDHIGVFGSGEDTIHNGAMDNAAGVASLIDLAERLRASRVKLRRSVAFVALTAEELGLLGSEYFARRPPLPESARMVANINLDMFLPVLPMQSLIAYGTEESTLEAHVMAAAQSVGVTAERDPVPHLTPFIRSDQVSFVRVGVPSLMLGIGAAGDKEAWKAWESWMASRYHKPNDDADQPVNMEAAEKFQETLLALVMRVANAESAPEWKPESPFRPAR